MLRMNVMKLAALAMTGALVACGAPSKKTTSAGSSATETGAAVLTLGEYIVGEGDSMVVFHADGRVIAVMGPEGEVELAKFGSDGHVVFADGKTADLKADGTFVLEGGKSPFSLEGETLVMNGKRTTINDKGEVITGQPGPVPEVTGATTPAQKRTVLVALGIMAIGE